MDEKIRNKTLAVRKKIHSKMGAFEELRDSLERMKQKEEERFEHLTPKRQEGEAGQKIQGGIDALDEALSEVDNIIGSIESAVENLGGTDDF